MFNNGRANNIKPKPNSKQKADNGTSSGELNYVTANRFYVEMQSENTISASFSECSGLEVKINKKNHREGGVNDQQRVILGEAEFLDVTLKRGITNDFAFWDWINSVIGDYKQPSLPIERRNINILLFNQAGETIQYWTLLAAVPVGWKAPALQADANTVAIEELTLAYEGLKIEKPGGGKVVTSFQSGRSKSGYFE
ncbi:hypothetical protein NIES267_10090 [Calothrix parasitica NIES-267]|uniref:Phage tail protein n=1 Tax=Calothrix parasitica NIES-267 TaxID=1973488 RepID=A0A1Z4LJX2_9CYAN|nr:hypothetical protein NIES267_10090 [Calothrix parasitica NIES-267]